MEPAGFLFTNLLLHVATVLGVFQMGAPLGIVTGAVVGSLVSAHWGWRPAFLVVALPGLVLADAAGRPSEAAEAVLRHGATLALAEEAR